MPKKFPHLIVKITANAAAMVNLLITCSGAVWALDISADNARAQLTEIEMLLVKDPNNKRLQIDRGIALGYLNRYQEEIDQAKTLLKTEGTLRNSYMLLEHGYAGLGRYQDALDALSNAFLLTKASPSELLLKATLLIENKQFRQALVVCNQVISASPRNAEAYERRADCYFQIYGPCEKSLNDLQKSATLDPGCERVQILLKKMKVRLTQPNGR